MVQYRCVTDGKTDRQTDRIRIGLSIYSASLGIAVGI